MSWHYRRSRSCPAATPAATPSALPTGPVSCSCWGWSALPLLILAPLAIVFSGGAEAGPARDPRASSSAAGTNGTPSGVGSQPAAQQPAGRPAQQQPARQTAQQPAPKQPAPCVCRTVGDTVDKVGETLAPVTGAVPLPGLP